MRPRRRWLLVWAAVSVEAFSSLTTRQTIRPSTSLRAQQQQPDETTRATFLGAVSSTLLLTPQSTPASVAEPSASVVGKGVERDVARKILQIERLNVDSNSNGDPKKHLPVVDVSGSTVKCSVPHVMDPAKPHFIEYIWLKDEKQDAIIAAKQFAATDPSPPTLSVSNVPKGTTVIPVAYCNLHGLWIGDEETV